MIAPAALIRPEAEIRNYCHRCDRWRTLLAGDWLCSPCRDGAVIARKADVQSPRRKARGAHR